MITTPLSYISLKTSIFFPSHEESNKTQKAITLSQLNLQIINPQLYQLQKQKTKVNN
jgi:hypothetical protein